MTDDRVRPEKLLAIDGLDIAILGREGDLYFDNLELQPRSSVLLRAIVPLLSERETIVDAGANIGLTSIFMAKSKPSSKIYAFEPATSTYSLLLDNIHRNDAENVQAYRLALGAQEGSVAMIEDPCNSSAAHVGGVVATSGHGQSVPLTTIDRFCDMEGVTPDFIKIDVEGLEYDVLEGARQTVVRYSPLLLVEMNSFTTIAYGGRNPRDLIMRLIEGDRITLWERDGALEVVESSDGVSSFFHHHLTKGSPVTDLLSVPSQRKLDLQTLRQSVQKLAAIETAAAAQPSAAELRLRDKEAELDRVYSSNSWRVTAPLRMVAGLLDHKRRGDPSSV